MKLWSYYVIYNISEFFYGHGVGSGAPASTDQHCVDRHNLTWTGHNIKRT